MRVARQVNRRLLQSRTKRLQLRTRRIQRGIERLLICAVECSQVNRANRLIQSRHILLRIRRKRRQQRSARDKFKPQIRWIRTSLRKLNARIHAVEGLRIDCVQQFHRNQDLVPRLRLIKQNDRLQVVAQCHSAPIEVDDLRHGPIRSRAELKPDACPCQVIPIQSLRHLNKAPIPNRIVRPLAPRLHRLPRRVTERGIFPMRQITRVIMPLRRRKFAEAAETFYRLLR